MVRKALLESVNYSVNYSLVVVNSVQVLFVIYRVDRFKSSTKGGTYIYNSLKSFTMLNGVIIIVVP